MSRSSDSSSFVLCAGVKDRVSDRETFASISRVFIHIVTQSRSSNSSSSVCVYAGVQESVSDGAGAACLWLHLGKKNQIAVEVQKILFVRSVSPQEVPTGHMLGAESDKRIPGLRCGSCTCTRGTMCPTQGLRAHRCRDGRKWAGIDGCTHILVPEGLRERCSSSMGSFLNHFPLTWSRYIPCGVAPFSLTGHVSSPMLPVPARLQKAREVSVKVRELRKV